jgi:hypothetical protein
MHLLQFIVRSASHHDPGGFLHRIFAGPCSPSYTLTNSYAQEILPSDVGGIYPFHTQFYPEKSGGTL